MRKFNFLVLAAALFYLVPLDLPAQGVESVVKRARDKKGKIFRCSVDGTVKDTEPLKQVLETCNSGSIIQIVPGNYNVMDITESTKDNLVIEGDGSAGMVAAHLVLHGKGCVVRNIKLMELEGRGLTVIDSRIGTLVLWGDVGKVKSNVFNCALNMVSIYPNNADVSLKNVSIIHIAKGGTYEGRAGYGGHGAIEYFSTCTSFGKMEKKGTVEMEDCLVYSNGDWLSSSNLTPPAAKGAVAAPGSELINLELKNCLIYARGSMVTFVTGKDKKQEVKSLKGLEAYLSLKLKGKTLQEEPKFVLPLPEAPVVTWFYDNIEGKNYVLEPRSEPARAGMGVKMGANGMPDPKTL